MDQVKQGLDFVHLCTQHILLLLFRTLQDVLDQNPALAQQLGLGDLLLPPSGAACSLAGLSASGSMLAQLMTTVTSRTG